MRPCLLLVIRNQESLLSSLLPCLTAMDIPILVVDAGSQAIEAARLEETVSQQGIELIRLIGRSGKGIALRVGFDEAQRLGYTHVLQHDVDIAFDTSELQALLTAAEQAPDTLFYSSYPQGSERKPGFAAHLARAVTGDRGLAQLKGGVTLLPLAPITRLLSQVTCCSGAGFTTEVLVRASWRRLPIQGFPLTRLKTRHKRIGRLWDHAIQLAMYGRLCLGGLVRAPVLSRRAWVRHHHHDEERRA